MSCTELCEVDHHQAAINLNALWRPMQPLPAITRGLDGEEQEHSGAGSGCFVGVSMDRDGRVPICSLPERKVGDLTGTASGTYRLT
jgi:hypothetical protein